MTGVPRYRFDELRRFGAALAQAAGVAPARASSLAVHLLWFDAAGAASFGIASLADWLDRIEAKQVDPTAEGRVTFERAGTALVDGLEGVTPLILARAAELAIEKARDCGVGLVRVANLAGGGPEPGIAAEIAQGPFVGIVLGPGCWAMALPAEGGLPVLYHSGWGPVGSAPGRIAAVPAQGTCALPWALMLTPDGGWLVGALSVMAMEPLATFQERVAEGLHSGVADGSLRPDEWEARRREVREHGVPIEPWRWERLTGWAARFGIGVPSPCAEC